MRSTHWLFVCALCALSCRGESGGADKSRATDPESSPVATGSDSPAGDGQSVVNPDSPAVAEQTGEQAGEQAKGTAAHPDGTGVEPGTEQPGLTPGVMSGNWGRPERGHGLRHEHGHRKVPFAPCPLPANRVHDINELLGQATRSHRLGHFAAAFDCASAAVDMAPRSIDAHHMRAGAAAALGHFDIAQLAFALALALDPDDPATLSAAAEFYINTMPRTGREPILVGLEYARRGRSQATERRGVPKLLRAQLTLLEAQALNDIGRPDQALSRVDAALRLRPSWLDAHHERGVALFNLCRFNGAKDAFAQVIMGEPDDAFAHHHLGLIHEHLGRAARSEHHFRKARTLAPTDFFAPVDISAEEFEREVSRALDELPVDLQVMLEDVAIEVVDLPGIDDLTAVEPPFSPTILGLFRGLPLTVGADAYGPDIPPRAIVLYRKNLARTAHNRKELNEQIRATLMHEIGHLSGLDEDELRRRGLE